MNKTVYTNYWVNKRAGVKKEHGSYKTEEDALRAIKAWWEIHNEKYNDIEKIRTNTGALEVLYGDPNYFYRIEERQTSETLPANSYRIKTPGEIEALRNKHQLDKEKFLFDELAEPYRDRIILAMNSIVKARKYTYTEKGQPIVKFIS